MPQLWRNLLLTLLAAPLLFISCKKQFSSDNPLPTSYTPSIIVGSDNQIIYALDPITGAKNWELGLSFPTKASPILYNGSVYIASSVSDTIYKINSKTGVVTKKFTESSGSFIYATPIASGNLLYVATMSGTLYALDTGTGNIQWFYAGGEPIQSSPTIYNNYIYFATTMGSVYCLDKTLGGYNPNTLVTTPIIWSLVDIPGASFVSSPAIAAPYMYIGSLTDSNMYCMYLAGDGGMPGSGVIRWTFKTSGAIYSSPTAYAGTCIFGSNDFRVYCLDTTINPAMGITTPQPRWIDSTHSIVYSSPLAYNQVIYVGSEDYNLYALNIINGSVKWKFASTGLIKSSPVAYKNTVYIGSYDKSLYALDTALGTIKWKKNINGTIDCSPVIDDFTALTGYNSQISGYTN